MRDIADSKAVCCLCGSHRYFYLNRINVQLHSRHSMSMQYFGLSKLCTFENINGIGRYFWRGKVEN